MSGSKEWTEFKKSSDALHRRLAMRTRIYGFSQCGACGTQHTGKTMTCRNCNAKFNNFSNLQPGVTYIVKGTKLVFVRYNDNEYSAGLTALFLNKDGNFVLVSRCTDAELCENQDIYDCICPQPDIKEVK